MGDPKQTTEHIPQLIWAIIKSLRYFYNTVCTKDDLNPEDGDLPCLPSASLDAYTFLLKAELPIEVDGIPDQWLPTINGLPQHLPQLPLNQQARMTINQDHKIKTRSTQAAPLAAQSIHAQTSLQCLPTMKPYATSKTSEDAS